jgi:hypothetical protein
VACGWCGWGGWGGWGWVGDQVGRHKKLGGVRCLYGSGRCSGSGKGSSRTAGTRVPHTHSPCQREHLGLRQRRC